MAAVAVYGSFSFSPQLLQDLSDGLVARLPREIGDRSLPHHLHTDFKTASLVVTCQAYGVVTSMLGVVGPVSISCD